MFTTNGKREIRIYVFLKKKYEYKEEKKYKVILTFDDNAKLLNFSEKLKTPSGKFLPFVVCRKRGA